MSDAVLFTCHRNRILKEKQMELRFMENLNFL